MRKFAINYQIVILTILLMIIPSKTADATSTEILPWGVQRIRANLVWDYNGDMAVDSGANAGDGVKVAVLDTGIDYNHPDLADNVKGGKSFVYYTDDYMDDHWHGTWVAGIIAGSRRRHLLDLLG